MTDDPQCLVSTRWLAERLGTPDLCVIDASWHMPATGRDARAEYKASHIPCASFYDIDAGSDLTSPLPHMAPDPYAFAAQMRALGVNNHNPVVIYDNSDVHSAARLWWQFRLTGRHDVAVLDGGFAKWRAEGLPTATAIPSPRDRAFTADPRPRLVSNVTQVAAASKLGQPQIVDARSAERFRGEAPEPRPGLASGHIPGARNLPFGRLYRDDGTMADPDTLRAEFVAAGVDLDAPVITSCGSGMTAACLALALERLGHRAWSLYDGSWTEWGGCPDLTIATGDA